LDSLSENDALIDQLAKLRLEMGISGGSMGGGDSALASRRRGMTGASGGMARSSFGGAPRNPEAVQLLRILQVVADVSKDLPEAWSFAKEWLLDVCDRKNQLRWEGEGLPLKEVKALCLKLGILSVEVVEATPTKSAQGDVIEVAGAGQAGVDGQYQFSDTDDKGCPHYLNTADDCFALYSEKNVYGDVRWVLAFLDPVLNGEPEKLYQTNFTMTQKVESPFPPSQPRDWTAFKGRYPAPSVEAKTNCAGPGCCKPASGSSLYCSLDCKDFAEDAPVGASSTQPGAFL